MEKRLLYMVPAAILLVFIFVSPVAAGQAAACLFIPAAAYKAAKHVLKKGKQ